MRNDCHVHISLDGANNKTSVQDNLKTYADMGVTFLRDGGDNRGLSLSAKAMAKDYGIDYRTPNFAIYEQGRYGANFGHAFETEKDAQRLLARVSDSGADFVKCMFSGIMDFETYGQLSCLPVPEYIIKWFTENVEDYGYSIMAHINGDEPIKSAIANGVASIEHGYYMSAETIKLLADSQTIWTPTLAPLVNLVGDERFNSDVLMRIIDEQREKIYKAAVGGAYIACGSDGGAYKVPPSVATATEYDCLKEVLGSSIEAVLERSNNLVSAKFSRQ